jgi:hypothetical protein
MIDSDFPKLLRPLERPALAAGLFFGRRRLNRVGDFQLLARCSLTVSLRSIGGKFHAVGSR